MTCYNAGIDMLLASHSQILNTIVMISWRWPIITYLVYFNTLQKRDNIKEYLGHVVTVHVLKYAQL